MAKINDLKLDIQPTGDSSKHKVTVSFKLSFNQPEFGKKFRYSIKLLGMDIGEPSTPSSPYLFKFGDNFYKGVTGNGPLTAIIKETREVPREDLDEDFDFSINNPGGPDIYKVFQDELVAVVKLERGAVGGIVGAIADQKVSSVKAYTA